jgi:transketolase
MGELQMLKSIQLRLQSLSETRMKERATRDAYGEALLEMGEKYADLVVFEADISTSTKTCLFAKSYPKRFFNMGVAEQNMMVAAAGISTIGFIPFVSTYAVFASMKCCEQIRTFIAYPKLNVKIAVSHGGFTPCNDGVTHQATEDLSIMRSIPNLTVCMPADAVSTKVLVEQAYFHNGPVYLRFTRDPVPTIYEEGQRNFQLGRSVLLQSGNDVTLIAIGDMVHIALEAANQLEKDGISTRVIDMHTVKPLDTACVLNASMETKGIVSLENNNVLGGLGSAICEYLSEVRPTRVLRIGLRDTFAESGKYGELLTKYKMACEDVAGAAREIMSS